MKKLLILAVLFSGHVMADCQIVESLARTMMKARQSGMPAVELLKVIEQQKETPQVKTAMKNLMVEAYKQPRFSVEEYQQNAINDFANEWFVMCLQNEESNKA